MCVFMYVCMCSVYVCMPICACAQMCVCVHVCMQACVYTYVCTYLCHMEKSEDNFQTQFLISVLLKQARSFCHCAVTARLGDQ